MKVKLGEVCVFQRGQSITKKDIIEGDIPVVAGGKQPAYYHNKANRDKDIITVSSSGANAGYINFWTVPIFSSDSFTIKPKNNNQLFIKYIYYFLKSRQEYLYTLSRGCGIPHIYISDVEPFEIILVDIQTQKEIVAVLDKVTLLISMRKEQLEKLDILVKSKFIEMFGDPVLNPKGWEKKKGNKLFNFTNGRFLNTNNRRESGIPVYGGNGVAWYTNEYFISFPTIIIGRVGEKCGNIHYSTGPIWVTDNAIYISQFLQNIFNLIYLSYEMDLLNFRSMAEGGGQPKITQKILNDCFYRVPPLELQNQFAEFVEQVEKNKEKIKSSLNQLETLYSALMQ